MNKSPPAKKPSFRITRNNVGTAVLVLFAFFTDMCIMMYSSISIFRKAGFSRFQVTKVKLELIVYLISFIAASLSLIFILAILFVSSLTVKKRKRLKILPYLMLVLPKLAIFLWGGQHLYFLALFVKDAALYAAMSHTSKVWFIRKFFKPYKQVVSYE